MVSDGDYRQGILGPSRYSRGWVQLHIGLPLSLSVVHEVFHVCILRKYTLDPTHVGDWGEFIIDTYGTFEEGPMRIMDYRD